MIRFSSDDFNSVARLLRERSGICLGPNKAYLLEARVAPLLVKYSLKDSRAFTAGLQQNIGHTLVDEFVECMTTNETLFFRDQRPFDLIDSHVLAQLREKRAHHKRIRIWCAAASTGQEPYSLAMLFAEQKDLWRGWTIDIVASDLSKAALAKAQRGAYSQFEVQRGLPIRLLMKYFTQDGNDWLLAPEIRAAVRFAHHNLLSSVQLFGTFDLVLVRNLLIYFDLETKQVAIDRIARAMAPDGFLILGAAETTLHYSAAFRPLQPDGGLYVKTAYAADAPRPAASTAAPMR